VKYIGMLLMLTGVGLWLLAVYAWLAGIWVSLSPAAAKFYLLILVSVTGAALLAAGAAMSKLARRHDSPERTAAAPDRVRT
jgi:hypothetical protein